MLGHVLVVWAVATGGLAVLLGAVMVVQAVAGVLRRCVDRPREPRSLPRRGVATPRLTVVRRGQR